MTEDDFALGLLANAPRLSARRSLELVNAIGAAIGGPEAAARLMRMAGVSEKEIGTMMYQSFVAKGKPS